MNSKNLFDLKGKVAVVTGASSGLGVQMAKALAGQGADIAILARRKEKLDKVADELRELGVKCLSIQCDVTDIASIKSAVAAVKAEYGKADILINNAGSGGVGPAEETTDDDWSYTISVDLDGVFKIAREFGKLMIENKYGRIINISSMYGMVGNMALPAAAYHAAKGGVVNLTRALAAEWAKHNITVNCLCPGYFATELTVDTLNTEYFTNYMKASVPVGRYGNEGELDTATLFLASENSAYVTGVILPVDGGYTCV
ncbi:SDR family oxidoreductase [Ruminiclostridium herbifermentans]|uniref:SDR family oxidoreductase n=1 Tax=Ruminiclostridium herbifermentans TaxID=2488810 RepID=A0A4U7JJ94_9FIRM|nr:SDR family oxidoreductase [Ruminiclostridium herbifermentans]QNU65982.1 SDR family oxidoreductase [Ruminiclostridium herbifermentans]